MLVKCEYTAKGIQKWLGGHSSCAAILQVNKKKDQSTWPNMMTKTTQEPQQQNNIDV